MVYRISHTTKVIKGNITLPASKSISNRLLIIKEIGRLKVDLKNISTAKDTVTFLQCISKINETTVFDVGHAGTTMRFLTAYFASIEGERILTGSVRMKQRPITELVNCLRKSGAEITYLEKEGFPPIKIKGKKLSGGKIEMNGSISSQYISALLMIAPNLSEALEIEFEGELVSKPYIDMTMQLMNYFGAEVCWKGNSIYCNNKPYSSEEKSFTVEADWSSASYLYAIAALAKEAELKIHGLQKKSLQADSMCVVLFDKFGIKSDFTGECLLLTKTNNVITPQKNNFTNCPDIAQTIAVVMAGKGISGKLNGLKTLRIKETDRISALHNELQKLGIPTEVGKETVEIDALFDPRTSNEAINTYHDHRMALAFAPLALVLDHIDIDDPMVIEKSYPEYWEHLKQLGFSIEEVSVSSEF
ncbi:MAG: 3-phosphoshikimate 1-carboxyvinyltransferase [Bacteroidota bacterium]|nr:3-phosphoshikimate 1-carboxyvinyltransferase [Bacteroidota bacterium]